MKTIFVILFELLIVNFSIGQSITFMKTYSAPYMSISLSGLITNDGQYLAAGYNYQFEGIDTIIDCNPFDENPFDTCFNEIWKPDIFILKANEVGDSLWSNTIGGSKGDFGLDIKQTNDNGFIIVGITPQDSNELKNDGYLIKTNSFGDTLWTKIFKDSVANSFVSVLETNDNGFLICGTTETDYDLTSNILLIKTDSIGNGIWNRTISGTEDYSGRRVIKNGVNDFIITASISNDGILIMKIDSIGNTIWSKTYSIQNVNPANISKTNDGGFIISGTRTIFGSNYDKDGYLFKLNSVGDSLWFKLYIDTIIGESFSCIQQTNDNGFIISGTTGEFNGGQSDCLVFKTDASGNIIWKHSYNFDNGNSDVGSYIQATDDSGYIVIGTTGYNRIFMLKLDASGLLTGDNPIRYLPNNNVRIYPNPFSTQTTLQTDIFFKDVTLILDNCLGQTVKQIKNITGQTIILQRDNLSSGLYFIRLTKDNKIITTNKLIITD